MLKDKLTFEEALAWLEKSAEDLEKPGQTLEETISNFEKGIGYYNKCNEMLNDARRTVSTFTK